MTEREIFTAALTKDDPAERAALLDHACAGDAALRQRIESLLADHPQLGSFMDVSSPAATIEQSPPERPGTQIGPYKLLQQIGEGGMGTVYMAEQKEPVQRKVALKVIKPGMDSRQVIARFEAERQALAMMDHVNIARVLDAGATEAGRPYFVMELVHGVPITKYCDDNRLTPRQRLELFVPVCQAIQHAHQKGIIHRDIKPSNVMVTLYDGKPVPKVIDFGVAKATEQKLTERTLFTQYGTMVGTLEYMSPEQAEMSALGIDTRSDIYSLGVLLYELLTGSTPLSSKRMKEAAYGEILRLIKEEEPPKPSTRLSESGEALASISAQRHTEPAKLSKLMRGELDWIVMKTLEKDRNRRYETANGFAADLERYLNDEPVQACPPSAWYRLRKFARRNRAAVLTIAAILLVLVAGMTGTTFGLIRAEHRRAEAEQARTNEAAQRKIADAQRKQAEQARAAEAAQRQIADAQRKKAEKAEADTLADYRASTDDAIEQLIGSKPDLGPPEKAYLEKTLKRWQAFATRQGDDQRSRAIRAEGHRRVAYLWLKLGRLKEARNEYETALDLGQKLAADYPAEHQYQTYLANTHSGLAYVLAELGERDAARAQYETARDLQQNLADAFPALPSYQNELAQTHNLLGSLLCSLGEHAAARIQFETSRDLGQKLVLAFPTVPRYQFDLAGTHQHLGVLLLDLGQREAARKAYETARDLEQKLVAEFPAVPEYQLALSYAHRALGNLLLDDVGKRGAARTEYEKARDLQKELAAAFPAVPQYQRDLAGTHCNLGKAQDSLGRPDAALADYEMARDLLLKLAAKFPAVPDYQTDLASTHRALGILLERQGQRDAARTEHEKARNLFQKLAADFPAVPHYQDKLALAHNSLGILFNHLGERDAARAEYEAAGKLLKKLVAAYPDVPIYQASLGGVYCNFGSLVRGEGQPADSLRWYDRAIDVLTPVYERDRRGTTGLEFLRNSHWGRAMAYDQLKKYDEAVKDWDKLIELDAGLQQPGYRLARVASLLQIGQTAEAIAQVEELSKGARWSAGERYRCACIFATASTRIDDRKQEYADRAMEFLAQAVQAGFKERSHMARDPDLAPLRDREDFLKLVAGPARTEFETARARLEKLVAEFPSVPQHQLELARTHQNYGTQLAQLGLQGPARTEQETAINLIQKLIAAFPAASEYQIRLGGCYNSYGFMVRNQGQPADSLHWFDLAIRTLTPVYERNPRAVTAQQLLRAGHWGRAVAYDQLNKHTVAIQDWDKAIEFDTAMEQPGLRGGRAISRLKAGRSAEVVAEVDEFLTKASIASGGDWHSFACVYALASGKFADQKQVYGDRAMELLRRAVQAGYINAPLLIKDPHLEALRQREDFQKLVAELETRNKRRPGQ